MIGRPTKLTPELQKKICKYIATGNPYNRACKLCDISTTIFSAWRVEGEKARELKISNQFLEFLEATEKAHEQFIEYHLKNIHEAGKKDWRASMELLGRKEAREFAKKDNLNLHHSGEATIKIVPPQEDNNEAVNNTNNDN